jgi:transglutaminase-like putative cysteine protease
MSVFNIKHITKYTYNAPAVDCTNQIMLYPMQDKLQQVTEHTISITKSPLVEVFVDYFGNRVGMFSLVEPHTELIISSEAEVVTHKLEWPSDIVPASNQWQQLNDLCDIYPYLDFLHQEDFTGQKQLNQLINSIFYETNTPFQNALAFSEYVYNNFEYKKGITGVETNVDEIWNLKAGVCQDFAHILLLLIRRINIPARYVSGYICPKNHELRGEGATHAWVEAYIPDYGWIGLDPTNNCIASNRHVRLAVGRNFSDCTPVKGTYKGSSDHTLEVSVSIDNAEIQAFQVNHEAKPNFVYKNTVNSSQSKNSYQYYMEQMQQQQQQ